MTGYFKKLLLDTKKDNEENALKKYRENVDQIIELSEEDKISLREPSIKSNYKKQTGKTRLTHNEESAFLDMSGSNSNLSYRNSNLLDSIANFKDLP